MAELATAENRPSIKSQLASRQIFIDSFSLLGSLLMVTFGTLNMQNGNSVTGSLELVGAAVLGLNLLAYRATRNIAIASTLLLATIIALLVVMLTTGGTAGTGLYWYFALPPVAFFLTGKRQGLVWVLILYAVTGLVLVLRSYDLAMVAFPPQHIRQMLIALGMVTFSLYLYQVSREEAEIGQRESENDLQEYLDNMTTFSAKVAPDGTMLFLNKIAKQASGLGEKAIGQNFLEGDWWHYDPEVYGRIKRRFAKVAAGEIMTFEEDVRLTIAGHKTMLTLRLTMLPVLDQGKLKYILVEASNVTEEHRMEQAKSELVALVSHQLRTPISAIGWFSEMLLDGDVGKLTAEQHKDIQQIYQSNQRMAAIVDDMLMVSALELGKLAIRPEPVDLVPIIKRVLGDQLAVQRTDKTLKVKESYDSKVPQLSVDPQLLKVVLRNLISNAVKYTPDGGTVSIKMDLSRQKLQPQSKGSVRIIVSDTGYGIPVAEQKYIFRKLYRAENVKKKNTDGTGLGLFIARTALQQAGGTITFASEEEKGTTFTVLLPLEGMIGHEMTEEKQEEHHA